MELRPGTVVAARYRLEQPLAQGGQGTVWEARHLGLDMPCALKFMLGPGAVAPVDVAERFALEARAAARLSDPRVVRMLDFGFSEGRPFIAMERLEGETLGARLARTPVLSRGETLAIAHDVARALDEAHADDVVHRDLKPDNIFLVARGEVMAKVLDFGIAKLGGAASAPITAAGTLIGTPHYMSPEQAHGAGAVDHHADVWSLAVVVYECLVGARPFEGASLPALIGRILRGPAPVPSEARPGLPRTFDAWWERATSARLEQRFPTAGSLFTALEMALVAPNPQVSTAADGTRLGRLAARETEPAPPLRPDDEAHGRETGADIVFVPSMFPPSAAPTLGGSVRPVPLPSAQTPSPRRKDAWVRIAAAGACAAMAFGVGRGGTAHDDGGGGVFVATMDLVPGWVAAPTPREEALTTDRATPTKAAMPIPSGAPGATRAPAGRSSGEPRMFPREKARPPAAAVGPREPRAPRHWSTYRPPQPRRGTRVVGTHDAFAMEEDGRAGAGSKVPPHGRGGPLPSPL
ncbi:MAG: protein kinase [Myxococcota bacterium]